MKPIDNTQRGSRIAVYDSLAKAKQEFGENYGGYVFALTREQVEALLQGQVVAFDISDGEYAGFLVVQEVGHGQ